MANEELLTEKDRIAYSAIVKFIKEHGYSPSVRELCGILGKSSTATIQYRLNSLGKKGFIKTSSGEKRTIQVTSEIKERPAVDVVEVEKYKALIEMYHDLRENFIDFVCSGVPNVAPYCLNRCDGCCDAYGWCRQSNLCQGFNPAEVILDGERKDKE